MRYNVDVNPAKEQEFLQLLRAWQSLDVVWAFSATPETEEPADEEAYIPSWERKKRKNVQEIAEEYRDLVD